jgi:hypothetical protein
MEATFDTSDLLSGADDLALQIGELLRVEELRLLREKEMLLIVYGGRTGSRQMRRRAVELGRLHTENFLSGAIPTFATALS